jgi:hypothetical protein
MGGITVEFTAWPKTSRLVRDVTITEKIDGTNAAILIEPSGGYVLPRDAVTYVGRGEDIRTLYAQSRSRFVVPGNDNHGFAQWVGLNAETLVSDLGPGIHFGEWWGQGIQRKYGMDRKVFSLFNTAKWADASFETLDLTTVPILYQGVFSAYAFDGAVHDLERNGSVAAPGFTKPEGVCMFHSQSRKVYKWTFDGDGHKNG